MAFWNKNQICLQCDRPIEKGHRIRVVHHRFLWWRWETTEHRDCKYPRGKPMRSPFYPHLKVEQIRMNDHLAETLFGKEN